MYTQTNTHIHTHTHKYVQVDSSKLEAIILGPGVVKEVCIVDNVLLGGQESRGLQRVAFISPATAKVSLFLAFGVELYLDVCVCVCVCLFVYTCQVGDVIRQLHTAVRGTVMEDFIPQVIIPIPSLPRNADGSVDKFKLKSTQRSARLSWRMSVGFANYRAPQTPVQEAVVALMRQVFLVFGFLVLVFAMFAKYIKLFAHSSLAPLKLKPKVNKTHVPKECGTS